MRAALAAAGRILTALAADTLQYRVDRAGTWQSFAGRWYADDAAVAYDDDRGIEADASQAVLRIDCDGPVLALGNQVQATDGAVWEVVASQVRAMGGRYTLRRASGRSAGPNRRGVS